MPNLRGASPVGRGVGGRSYAARAIGSGSRVIVLTISTGEAG